MSDSSTASSSTSSSSESQTDSIQNNNPSNNNNNNFDNSSNDEQFSGASFSSSEDNEDVVDLPLALRLKQAQSGVPKPNNKATNLKRKLKSRADEIAASKQAKLDQKRKKMQQIAKKQKLEKSRPVEVSSKIPVGRYRSVVPVKNLKGRDPRFESFAGHLNLGHVQNAYKFVSDLEKQEQKSLQKALKREKDPDRRFEIEKKLTRMQQEFIRREQEANARKVRKQLEQVESEKVAQGKQPFYIKKADFKEKVLEQEFNELKKTGRARRITDNRMRRAAAKSKKQLPKRREYDDGD